MIGAFTEDMWRTVLKEFLRVLKPGGKVQIIESGKFRRKEGELLMDKAMPMCIAVSRKIGLVIDVAERLEDLLREAGFVDIHSVIRECPVGKAWGEVGERGFDSFSPAIRAYGGACVKMGFLESIEEADELIGKAVAEWNEVSGVYLDVRAVCALKPL